MNRGVDDGVIFCHGHSSLSFANASHEIFLLAGSLVSESCRAIEPFPQVCSRIMLHTGAGLRQDSSFFFPRLRRRGHCACRRTPAAAFETTDVLGKTVILD